MVLVEGFARGIEFVAPGIVVFFVVAMLVIQVQAGFFMLQIIIRTFEVSIPHLVSGRGDLFLIIEMPQGGFGTRLALMLGLCNTLPSDGSFWTSSQNTRV